jgi:hypothetical protein
VIAGTDDGNDNNESLIQIIHSQIVQHSNNYSNIYIVTELTGVKT